MDDVEFRPARAAEWSALGGLRWDSLLENGGVPGSSRDDFAARFAEWAGGHGGHECFVAFVAYTDVFTA